MAYFLGIDLGTSSVKAIVVSEDGKVAGSGSAEYPIDCPQPGMAEQDPERWWQAVVQSVHQALARDRQSIEISAIGLSGQMHGTVLLGAEGRLLTPAVIWPDQRSLRQVAAITQQISVERLVEISGSPVATGFQAATLLWFRHERAELWEQITKVFLPKDYLRWRLTGIMAAEPSDGSGSLLLDVRQRNWSADLLAALEVEEKLLPSIQPSSARAGTLQPEAAEALGLPAGTAVVTGAADTACSLLGAGVTSPDTLLVTLSTGGQLILPAFEVQVDRKGRMHTFCSALEPGRDQAGWYKMGATLSAGGSLRWLRDKVIGLSGEGAYAEMTAWAAEAPLGSRGLIFLPYLSGERTPLMDPQARCAFIGLALQHGRAELIRAVLEGVTLSLYEAYLVLAESGERPTQIILAGGGARSKLWQQMVADVFGLPVHRLQISEQSALGAAILAGAGVGVFEPVAVSRRWASYGELVEPQPDRHASYQDLLNVFRSAYEANKDLFQRLSRIAAS